MVVRSTNSSNNSGSGRTLKRAGSGVGVGGGAGIGLVAGYKSSRVLKKPTGSTTPDAEYDPHAERLRQDLKLMNNYSVKNLMKFESIKKSRNDGSGAASPTIIGDDDKDSVYGGKGLSGHGAHEADDESEFSDDEDPAGTSQGRVYSHHN